MDTPGRFRSQAGPMLLDVSWLLIGSSQFLADMFAGIMGPSFLSGANCCSPTSKTLFIPSSPSHSENDISVVYLGTCSVIRSCGHGHVVSNTIANS